MNECVVYDFETLSLDQRRGVVLSMALLPFSEDRYIENPYTYEELLSSCKYIKFDVSDQIDRFDRVINKETFQWWKDQGEEVKKQLQPSSQDQSINSLYDFIIDNIDRKSIKKSYCRGNSFDTMILQYIMEQTGKPEPFYWGNVRDTRSMIDGMLFPMKLAGNKTDNRFMPPGLEGKVVLHDPRHDVCLDVMRMQICAQILAGVSE